MRYPHPVLHHRASHLAKLSCHVGVVLDELELRVRCLSEHPHLSAMHVPNQSLFMLTYWYVSAFPSSASFRASSV